MSTQPQAPSGVETQRFPDSPVTVTMIASEQQSRAGAYSLLASLLRSAPSATTLESLSNLNEVDSSIDELALATSTLGLAAGQGQADLVDDEYHALFIGLGRGELVPFASWYLTGFLMERPLAVLREDLKVLGYERQQQIFEPEDHIAALCEVMAMMIVDNQDIDTQRRFFTTHIGNWANRFFNDLYQAKAAAFYRAVGRFGLAFIDLETGYLSIEA